MHVASLELCKELFELSGWADTEHCYYANGGLVNGDIVHQRSMVIDKPDNVPAYDLGYLLRRLPRYTAIEVDDVISATHTNQDHRDFVELADTPEDAAAKLAISLFEQGILKKGDSDG